MNFSTLYFVVNCFLFPSMVFGLDTIFAKGGTCMLKIQKQYQQCMDTQNARLTREKDHLEPIYTREALTDSVNKISCCAYWEFLSCVEEAAKEFCPNEKRDMEAYVRQLGSAVPFEECSEHYPRDSPLCDGSTSPSFAPSLTFASTLFVVVFTQMLF